MADGSLTGGVNASKRAEALTCILRDCDLQSLAVLYYALRESIEDPEVRRVSDEVVRASLRRAVRVLEAMDRMLEDPDGSTG